MTGLDLETFLQLLRADLGAWVSLGLVAAVLALMAWTSWGSRRALRKCLVLSIAAHIGLILYGSTFPIIQAVLGDRAQASEEAVPVRVQLAADTDSSASAFGGVNSPDGRPARNVAAWDRSNDKATLVDPSVRPILSHADSSQPQPPPDLAKLTAESVAPEVNPPPPTVATNSSAPELPPTSAAPLAGDSAEITASAARASGPVPVDSLAGSSRSRPTMSGLPTAPPASADRSPATIPSLAAAPTLALPAATNRPSGDAPGPASDRLNPAPAAVVQADPAEVKTAVRAPENLVGFTGTGRVRTPRETVAAPPAKGAARPIAPASTVALPSAVTSTKPALAAAPAMGGASSPAATIPAVVADLEPPKTERRGPLIEGPRDTLNESNTRRISRPTREAPLLAMNDSQPNLATPRVTPTGIPGLPAITGASGLTRPNGDVPQVYRSRLDPNRFALALRAGATGESEQAVERALEWLRKHQDADGRWDAGAAKMQDGSIRQGDDDYTTHCPPGDICFGQSMYWDSDTGLTGLALLAYLGSGYTHIDGQYTETVAKGLEYLRLIQKPDGDLRGESVGVGMYCHSMATLALCEAYALTGDPKLKAPIEKAIGFLVRSRAVDGLSWRYTPRSAMGDTSILGWVVMALKSAQESGLPISANTRQGILTWLGKVSAGRSRGLAMYQPGKAPTVSMTAEAWVCRQFLGVGGPGLSSTEAANYLLQNAPDKSEYNIYTWYYGTLAMYQHGGDPWVRWNTQVRDQLIRRQRLNGHATGSWDPDTSEYGSLGGRIYTTALATLTLEVYYRYLRLYEIPPTTSAAPAASRPAPADIISEPAVNPR